MLVGGGRGRELLTVETAVRRLLGRLKGEAMRTFMEAKSSEFDVSTFCGLAVSQLLPDLCTCLSFTGPSKAPCLCSAIFPLEAGDLPPASLHAEQLVIRFLMNVCR